jgi:hypothetical protein
MAKIAFTAGRVSGFKCPPDKKQAFMWDATAPGLGLRATPAGKPAYVFQGLYQGKDLRLTIGSPAAWSIPDAQAKARELQRLIDEGKDPGVRGGSQMVFSLSNQRHIRTSTRARGSALRCTFDENF